MWDLCSFFQEQPNQVNYGNICTGLEVLSFLLTVLQSPAILSSFKPLQRGIAACMTCGNTKVLRAVHSLLSRLMSIFPTEPSMSPLLWVPFWVDGWSQSLLLERAHPSVTMWSLLLCHFSIFSTFLKKLMWELNSSSHCILFLSALEMQFFISWVLLIL